MIRRHSFLLIAVLALVALFALAAFPVAREDVIGTGVLAALRIVLLPAYIVRLLVMELRGGQVWPYGLELLTVPLVLLPYWLLDAAVGRLRRRS